MLTYYLLQYFHCMTCKRQARKNVLRFEASRISSELRVFFISLLFVLFLLHHNKIYKYFMIKSTFEHTNKKWIVRAIRRFGQYVDGDIVAKCRAMPRNKSEIYKQSQGISMHNEHMQQHLFYRSKPFWNGIAY